MQTPGLFITFEGIDGAGKSTHIEKVAQAFRAAGRAVTLTREPGGTPLAEKLRALVLGDAMDPLCEALLMFAARRDHLQTVIEPALAAGGVVICDRFTDATFAYQGFGRGFDLAVLHQLEAWVQGRPEGGLREPDLTLWFDLSPAVAAKRLAGARVPDRFEAQPQAFFLSAWPRAMPRERRPPPSGSLGLTPTSHPVRWRRRCAPPWSAVPGWRAEP